MIKTIWLVFRLYLQSLQRLLVHRLLLRKKTFTNPLNMTRRKLTSSFYSKSPGVFKVNFKWCNNNSVYECYSRSSKKGLVIPHWPRHRCGDFEAFTTTSWWYNYHTYENVTDIRYILRLDSPGGYTNIVLFIYNIIVVIFCVDASITYLIFYQPLVVCV